MSETTNRAPLDAELGQLSAQLLAMGGLAESQLSQALYAITRASGETASQVLELERRVNAGEVAIERELWALVARQQPNSRDLRLLIAVSKMVRDIERIGDEASRVARIAHRLLGHGLVGPLREPLKAIGSTRRSTPLRGKTWSWPWPCCAATSCSTPASTSCCAVWCR